MPLFKPLAHTLFQVQIWGEVRLLALFYFPAQQLKSFPNMYKLSQNCICHILIMILRDTENYKKMQKEKFSTGKSENLFRSLSQLAPYRFLSGPYFVFQLSLETFYSVVFV